MILLYGITYLPYVIIYFYVLTLPVSISNLTDMILNTLHPVWKKPEMV